MYIMATRVVEFSNGGYKIRKIFAFLSYLITTVLKIEKYFNLNAFSSLTALFFKYGLTFGALQKLHQA